jgi:hypothetical protein
VDAIRAARRATRNAAVVRAKHRAAARVAAHAADTAAAGGMIAPSAAPVAAVAGDGGMNFLRHRHEIGVPAGAQQAQATSSALSVVDLTRDVISENERLLFRLCLDVSTSFGRYHCRVQKAVGGQSLRWFPKFATFIATFQRCGATLEPIHHLRPTHSTQNTFSKVALVCLGCVVSNFGANRPGRATLTWAVQVLADA